MWDNFWLSCSIVSFVRAAIAVATVAIAPYKSQCCERFVCFFFVSLVNILHIYRLHYCIILFVLVLFRQFDHNILLGNFIKLNSSRLKSYSYVYEYQIYCFTFVNTKQTKNFSCHTNRINMRAYYFHFAEILVYCVCSRKHFFLLSITFYLSPTVELQTKQFYCLLRVCVQTIDPELL